MATDPSSDLGQFHQFIGEKLTSDPALSPEDALLIWRTEHPLDAEEEELTAFLREAVDDYKAGKPAIPAEQVLAELRERFGLKRS